MNHGSAVIFDARIPDCTGLIYGSWVLKEIWIIDLSSALVLMLISLSKLFLFSKEIHLNSGVRLLLEFSVLRYSHQECCLYYLGEIITVAFTCTSLPLKLYTSVFGCGFGFGLNKKFGGSPDLG